MAKNVRLYVIPNCDKCRAAQEYLDSKGIPYAVLDVDADAELMEELLVQHGTMGTPTFVIDDVVIPGLDQAKIEAALASK